MFDLARSWRILLLATFLVAPRALAAQTVEGEVTDAESGEAVVGAAMVLLDAAGERQGQTTTDRAGRYRLVAHAAGEHRVRVERIGYPAVTSEALPLAAGATVRRSFRLATATLSLEGVAVRAETRCGVRPEADERTAAVWEEARKALAAANAARADGAVRYAVRTYTRRTDPVTGRVEALAETPAEVRGRPFVPAPLDRLVTHGFVETAGGRMTYRAPDAETLLAPEFVDQHCFGLTADTARGGWVGLTFSPVPGRSVPDIEGVLWLDRRTAELRRADFTYTRLPAAQRNLGAGGALEFMRLAGGEWIISRWHIRMPHIDRPGRRVTRGTVPMEEQGGEVAAVTTADGSTVALHVPATLRGTVRAADGAPLPGVRVGLDGTVYAAETGEDGAFVLEGVMPGTYRPTLLADALALGDSAAVSLAPGQAARVELTARTAAPAWQVTLEGLRVEGRSAGLEALGFYARKAEGRGVFLTAAEFPRPATLLEVVASIRGMQVIEYTPPPVVEGAATFRPEPRIATRWAAPRTDVHGSAEPCLVPILLDGRMVLTDEPIPQRRIDQTYVAEVTAIEVYRRRQEVPEAFRTRHTTCGLVVVWTREHEAAKAGEAPAG
jgi:hypothetical protein